MLRVKTSHSWVPQHRRVINSHRRRKLLKVGAKVNVSDQCPGERSKGRGALPFGNFLTI